ncbi:MAG: thioredoxin family protein [Vicinamibacteria bacterium]|nr:thioredoxin family protein [Vicinamibacteria bacterium]
MRRKLSSGIAACLLLCCARAFATGIAWEPSFEAARKKARVTGQPLMVDFWAEWCGWCHELDRTTYADREVVKITGGFVAVKVDTEGRRSDTAVATRYRIDSLPTVVFLTPAGRILMKLNGFQRPARFARILTRVREIASEVIGWERAVESKPEDIAALYMLGMHLLEQEDYEEGVVLVERAHACDEALPVAERKKIRSVLGALRGAERRFAEAEALLKEGLALAPAEAEADSHALYTLGRVYIDWGRKNDARVTLERLVAVHPDTPAGARARRLLAY